MKLNFKKKGYVRDIFLLASQLQKGGKGKDQLDLVLCVTNYLYKKLKYNQKTSFWCEDCGKPLCITPCFQIYHTKLDFKKEAANFRVHALPFCNAFHYNSIR